MSGSASLGLEQAILGHTLGFAPMTAPTQVFVALCMAAQAPAETIRGIEVSGLGYYRTTAAFALAASPANMAANVAAIEFPMALAAWGTVGYFELWDAQTGGNRLYWGQLIDHASGVPATLSVMSGDIVRFSPATLLVQAFNPAIAAGGPFLPLTGGTVSGNVNVSGTHDAATLQTYTYRTQTGGTLNTALGIYGDLSGTVTGGNPYFATINLLNDTMDAGGAGLGTLRIQQNSGGAAATGNRVGLYINFNFTGGPTNKARGIGNQYAAQWNYATASGNVGGTTGSGNAYGELWGGLSSATLASGATFWSYCVGHEVDFGVSTGASATYTQGIKIVLAHHNQATSPTDFMLGMAKYALSDVGLGTGITFGTVDGYWPVANTGTLIGAQATNLPTPPAMSASIGIDFSNVTFSNYFLRSNGFFVDGIGDVVANAVVANNAGISCGANVGASLTDLSKHIALYTSGTPLYGFNVTGGFINSVLPASAAHQFVVNGAVVASIGASGIMTGPAGSPTWTSGSAAPAATAPVGSLYSRVGGAVGATLYISRGAGVWNPIAGV